jgi:hypothetical protein
LVQGGHTRTDKRTSTRWQVQVPGQIVWKDTRGSTRFARVVTNDVSDSGVAVRCLGGTPIPLYRLVYFQIDRQARQAAELPPALQKTQVLSAVCRVGECTQATGAPESYALRLLVEPERKALAVAGRPRQAC